MFFSACTLGCKLNQLETEAITDSFAREGFDLVPWNSVKERFYEAGILLINTCTVTSMAEQKARRIIRKALREHREACLIITGCYAQMEEAALGALGEGFFGRFFVIPGEKKDIILDLPRFLADSVPAGNGGALSEIMASWLEFNVREQKADGAGRGAFRYRPETFSSHSRGFLKIQDGCDRRCAYCRVSLARGKSVSLAAEEALDALKALERRGFAEAVLTGVNITQYNDSGMKLHELLEFLLKETGAIRLRLSSIEPDGLTDEFIDVLANPRIRPHFHLSLQSGSAPILTKMGRPYTPEDVTRTARRLREVRNDPFLACDIIAGFPGETAGEFEKTREFCEKTDFAWIHAFPFSPRPGTQAFGLPEKVSERDAGTRVEILSALAGKGRRAYLKRWEGKEAEAVIEAGKGLPKGFAAAVSENYLKLRVKCADGEIPAPGSLVRCRILGADALPRNVSRFDALAEKIG